VLLEHQELEELLVPPVLKELLDRLDHLVLKDQMVYRGQMELLGQMEHPALKVRKEIKGMRFKLTKFPLILYQILPTIQIIQKHMVILIQH
jgi:hypothetical protein